MYGFGFKWQVHQGEKAHQDGEGFMPEVTISLGLLFFMVLAVSFLRDKYPVVGGGG